MDANEDLNSIKERIIKLLAMAEHPNSNQHEAAVAAQKAAELLHEYELGIEEVRGFQAQPEIEEVHIYNWELHNWKKRKREITEPSPILTSARIVACTTGNI